MSQTGEPHIPDTNDGRASRGSDTRQRIVDTATELFGRAGVRGVGINEIWQQAGVAKSTLYQHFRSKDELVADVLRQRDQRWCDRLRRSTADAPSPRAALLAIFDLLDEDFAAGDYRGSDLINTVAEYPDPRHPVRQAIRDHKSHLLDYLTELAVTAGASEPREAAATVMALADGAVCARVSLEDRDAARRAHRAAAALLVADAATRTSASR